MSTVFSGSLWNALKTTLGKIVTDSTDGVESKAYFKKWMKEMTMADAYEDDAEYAGPAYASYTAEGAELPTVGLDQGYTKRYIPRKFGAKLIVTREAMRDNKYPKVIDAAKRLKAALYNSMDIDATDILINATSTSYPGGDGLPLASASHTLPSGGTWSNLMATPMSPSRAAVIIATSAIRKLPGHNGAYGHLQPKGVVCPTEQWAIWEELIGSTKAPEPGQFNAVNVVNKLGLEETCAIPWWDNTTTNYGIVTDCDSPLNFRWRDKPESATWVENSHQVSYYSISARWACGYSDARCIFFVNA